MLTLIVIFLCNFISTHTCLSLEELNGKVIFEQAGLDPGVNFVVTNKEVVAKVIIDHEKELRNLTYRQVKLM